MSAVALSRLRAEGGADAFRSRPPNTSRPPSLHVDDFTALHQPYSLPVARGVRRGSGSERGRFGAAHAHYRQL
ncbi:unnamed protein product [Euphydryas editha]|uniref:Uncharacterized protein n=1 Tax=Euphydryas editha TaxID=104508 RepID=A0AAU9TVF2_EUPED|nr:unnamed protein product [Euphydryas editha]